MRLVHGSIEIYCIAQFLVHTILTTSNGHISLVLYRVYPPPKPDSLTGLSSSQTGQLIRCPPYPPPTVGILISRVGFSFLFSRHIQASLGPAKARRISAGRSSLPAKGGGRYGKKPSKGTVR